MSNEKDRLNVVVLGHIGSGKDTTIGNLLYKCGDLDKSTIEKFETETNSKYTWVLDNLKAERESGFHAYNSDCEIETSKYMVIFVDAPGHTSFVENMLTRASEARCAILVVSSSPGEFESGISKDGQTTDQIRLAHNLGIESIVVVINKMDACQWSEGRYNEICKEMNGVLTSIGYESEKIPMIPVSGLHGDNLAESSVKGPWFDGVEIQRKSGPILIRTLLEAIDAVESPEGLAYYPLRLPIHDVFKIKGVGTVFVGRVESGYIAHGMTVNFAPAGISGEVVKLIAGNTEGLPGKNYGFKVKDDSCDAVCRGNVVYDPEDDYPAMVAASFTAQVVIIDHPDEIVAGYTSIIDIHAAHVACTWTELISKIDRHTSMTIEESPRSLKSGDSAIVKMVPTKPLCVESFSEIPGLGSFGIRDMEHNVAIGIIIDVENFDS